MSNPQITQISPMSGGGGSCLPVGGETPTGSANGCSARADRIQMSYVAAFQNPHAREIASMLVRCAVFVVAMLSALAAQAGPPIVIEPDVETGIYSPGESVTWNIVLAEPSAAKATIDYAVLKGGLAEIDKGTRELADGKTQVRSSRRAGHAPAGGQVQARGGRKGNGHVLRRRLRPRADRRVAAAAGRFRRLLESQDRPARRRADGRAARSGRRGR